MEKSRIGRGDMFALAAQSDAIGTHTGIGGPEALLALSASQTQLAMKTGEIKPGRDLSDYLNKHFPTRNL